MPEPVATQPYGPQTPLVRMFLQRLATQPAMAWLAAARRYAAVAATPAGRQADRGLGAAIQKSAREAARDALVGPVLQLAARAADAAALDSADREQVERLAEPALAAALALVVADRLGDDQRAILTSAFAAAVPPLDPAAASAPPDDDATPDEDATPPAPLAPAEDTE